MKKNNFNFLTTLVIASVWLCVSCSHNKKASALSGLSEEANEASYEEATAPAPEQTADAEMSLPQTEDASVPELASLTESEPIASSEPVMSEEEPAVSPVMELADASLAEEHSAATEVVTAEPQAVESLDGSEAGFLSAPEVAQAPATSESSAQELLTAPTESAPAPEATLAPVPAPSKVEKALKPARKPASRPHTQQHAVKPQAEMTAQAITQALGEAEPTSVAEAIRAPAPAEVAANTQTQEQAKPEAEKQLASPEMGSFTERNLFWIACLVVGFFGFTFVSLRRNKDKDMPL